MSNAKATAKHCKASNGNAPATAANSGFKRASDNAHPPDRRGDYMGHAGRRRRHRRLRLSRRRDSAGLRRSAQVSHPPHPGAPRAGRGAHGRRLLARFGQGGRGHCHQRPRRDQSGDRHRHRDAGFHSHRLHHRQRLQQGAGHRRLSGSGYYRHHAAGDQAQLPGEQGRRYCAGHSPRLPDRAIGRPGPVLVDITKDAQQATAGLRFRSRQAAPAIVRIPCCTWGDGTGAGRGTDSQLKASGDSGRSRRDRVRRRWSRCALWPSARRFPWP